MEQGTAATNNSTNFTIDDEERNPVLEDEYDIKTDIVMTNTCYNRTIAALSMIKFKKVFFYVATILLAFAIGRYSTSSSSSSSSGASSNRSRSSGGAANLNDVVLVTGATGRTGSKLYHELKHHRGVKDVRAFVRDADKAREVLGCEKCDESEGIYVGDVTNIEDLERVVTSDVTTLAIAVGASPSMSKEMQRSIEFDSVVNSVKALLLGNSNNSWKKNLKVVLCSTIGTATTPAPEWSGDIEFWKLNAEAFLPSSGLTSSVVVKPCGLIDATGRNATLVVGHDDEFMEDRTHITIAREDVARVMAEAVVTDSVKNQHYRFDLCGRGGGTPPTTDKELNALIRSSKWGF